MPEHAEPDSFILDCRGRALDCRPVPDGPAQVMGILNVTPDSFSDGGQYTDLDAALARTEEMIAEGAAIIDVGGESSRPAGKTYGEGAEAVALQEERERVVPVVEGIAARFPEVLISVDTYKPEVARAALGAGAHLINDITGLRIYPEMAEVAAEAGAPLILMHSLGRPGAMPHEHTYTDVVAEVTDALHEAVTLAQAAGVSDVAVDPGVGFGKTTQENLRLVNAVDRLVDLGHPVMVGISRKSSIGAVLGNPGTPVPIKDRLFGSLGATAVAVLRGASLVRTHDVGPTVDMLALLTATARAGQ